MVQNANINEVQVLTDVKDHLQYAESVLRRLSAVSVDEKNELRDQIERIKLRSSDPNLYLAIIGESSTGKSTLINAFMRHELLRAQSSTMTTAAATIVKYDETLSAEVRFRSKKSFLNLLPWQNVLKVFGFNSTAPEDVEPDLEFLTETVEGQPSQVVRVDENDEPINIGWIPGIKNLTLKEFIYKVTARGDDEERNELARHVLSASVTFPAEFLKNGIYLIDAPGMNSTDPEHTQVILDVAEQADTAIIIIPATRIVSVALTDFLAQESMQRYLHRCIFLVTFMDQIPPNERDKLMQTVKERLAGAKGLSFSREPDILACSAQAVVNDFAAEKHTVRDETDWAYWKDSFAELESYIGNKLRRERALTISENVLSLLVHLFDLMNGPLENQWQLYYDDQKELEANVIRDIESFADEQRHICSQRMNEVYRSNLRTAVDTVNQHRNALVESLKSALSQVTNKKELDRFVKTTSSQIINRNQKELAKALEASTHSMSREAKKVSDYFDERFEKEYRRLENLRILQANVGSTSSLLSRNQTDSRSMRSDMLAVYRADQQADQQKALMGMGAGLGALLLIGGPAGWAVAIGAVIFSNLLGPSIGERKTKVWNELLPKVSEAYETVERETRNATREFATQLEQNILNKVNAHVRQYKHVVDAAMQAHEDERERLISLQKELQNDLDQLKERRGKIVDQRETLVNTEISNN